MWKLAAVLTFVGFVLAAIRDPWVASAAPMCWVIAGSTLGYELSRRNDTHRVLRDDAERQHKQFLAGDPRGFYGDYMVDQQFLRPEYLMVADEKRQITEGIAGLSHNRTIGGDVRDSVWPRIAIEVTRFNYLYALKNPGAQGISEMDSIAKWINWISNFMRHSLPELLGKMAAHMREDIGVDLDEQVARYIARQSVADRFHLAEEVKRWRNHKAVRVAGLSPTGI